MHRVVSWRALWVHKTRIAYALALATGDVLAGMAAVMARVKGTGARAVASHASRGLGVS